MYSRSMYGTCLLVIDWRTNSTTSSSPSRMGSSGGISNFVQEGDSISEKLIPQLQSSLNQSLTSVEIHLDGQNNDDFMISPFPIPVINTKGTFVVFIKKKKQNRNNESLSCNVLIIGNYYRIMEKTKLKKSYILEKNKDVFYL